MALPFSFSQKGETIMQKQYGIPVRERESVFINLEKRISTEPDVKTIYGDYSKLNYIPCKHKPTIEEIMHKFTAALHKGLLGIKNDDIDDCLSWVDLNKKEGKNE